MMKSEETSEANASPIAGRKSYLNKPLRFFKGNSKQKMDVSITRAKSFTHRREVLPETSIPGIWTLDIRKSREELSRPSFSPLLQNSRRRILRGASSAEENGMRPEKNGMKVKQNRPTKMAENNVTKPDNAKILTIIKEPRNNIDNRALYRKSDDSDVGNNFKNWKAVNLLAIDTDLLSVKRITNFGNLGEVSMCSNKLPPIPVSMFPRLMNPIERLFESDPDHESLTTAEKEFTQELGDSSHQSFNEEYKKLLQMYNNWKYSQHNVQHASQNSDEQQEAQVELQRQCKLVNKLLKNLEDNYPKSEQLNVEELQNIDSSTINRKKSLKEEAEETQKQNGAKMNDADGLSLNFQQQTEDGRESRFGDSNSIKNSLQEQETSTFVERVRAQSFNIMKMKNSLSNKEVRCRSEEIIVNKDLSLKRATVNQTTSNIDIDKGNDKFVCLYKYKPTLTHHNCNLQGKNPPNVGYYRSISVLKCEKIENSAEEYF